MPMTKAWYSCHKANVYVRKGDDYPAKAHYGLFCYVERWLFINKDDSVVVKIFELPQLWQISYTYLNIYVNKENNYLVYKILFCIFAEIY